MDKRKALEIIDGLLWFLGRIPISGAKQWVGKVESLKSYIQESK